MGRKVRTILIFIMVITIFSGCKEKTDIEISKEEMNIEQDAVQEKNDVIEDVEVVEEVEVVKPETPKGKTVLFGETDEIGDCSIKVIKAEESGSITSKYGNHNTPNNYITVYLEITNIGTFKKQLMRSSTEEETIDSPFIAIRNSDGSLDQMLYFDADITPTLWDDIIEREDTTFFDIASEQVPRIEYTFPLGFLSSEPVIDNGNAYITFFMLRNGEIEEASAFNLDDPELSQYSDVIDLDR
jgi:hypothetical protein